MAVEISKKQLVEAKKKFEAEIEVEKGNVKALAKELKGISAQVASTARAYQSARDSYAKKQSEKNERKLSEANAAYKAASESYHINKASIERCLGAIDSKYQEISKLAESAANDKVRDRANGERLSYSSEIADVIAKSDRSEGMAIPVQEPAVKNEPAEKPAAEPVTETVAEPVAQQPVAQPAKASVTSVNVAPVSIDVTPMIEKALASAMDKLSESMAKKIEAYTASLKLPEQTPVTTQIVTVEKESSGNAELTANAEKIADTVSQLIEAEEHIIEKLKGMCTSVAEMLERLTAISENYHNVAIKEKQLAELGKQINDMQRRTTRDQQGVQVNQKLVTDEQLGIVAAQKLAFENHKALAAIEKEISLVQEEIFASQKETLPEVKKILKEQKQAVKKAESKEVNEAPAPTEA